MEKELISIVLTLYNKAPYIEETIFSIYKQTYTNRELIIVDDCSTDGSLEIAKSFCEKIGITNKCKFIKNEKNLRVAKTFERGLKEAKGEWISMCDGDDILMKNKLEKQIRLCQKEHLDFCFCGYVEIDENNNYIGTNKTTPLMERYFKDSSYKNYLVVNNATGSGLFFNKKIAEGLKGFGFPDSVYQDYWAIVGNYLLGGKVSAMNEKLFYYRRCNQCITSFIGVSQLQLYKKMLKMRFDIQNYVLKIIKKEDVINWTKKLNNIDSLFIDRLSGKKSIIYLIHKILISRLGLKYLLVLLYEAFVILFLKIKENSIYKKI